MLSFVIGLTITALAALLILKNFQPQTVLLLAGLSLLALTVVLYPEHSILYKKVKSSTGWSGFDIFAFAKNSLTTQIAGIGLVIMASAGFSEYMDHIGATRAMVRTCIKPLKWFKAPYVILAAGYVLGQCLHVAIPSAAGLAMLLLVTLFPLMISVGVSKPAAASMIGLTGFMDLGPAVGTANLAANILGLTAAEYFVRHQIPVATGVIVVVSVLLYFTARHFDRKAGHIITSQAVKEDEPTEKHTIPALYALIPLLPIALILVFSPLMVTSISLDVVTAMLIGALNGLFLEIVIKRDVMYAFKGFQAFFNGIGSAFASIVSLLVCADIFAQGLQAIGTVNYMLQMTSHAGFGVNAMSVTMTIMVCATAVMTGSGVAAFFAFSGLAPYIAIKFGVSAVTMILPMQLIAGMGRSISPVSGVIIAVSKKGECSPFEVVRRTMIPAIGGILTMLVINYLLSSQSGT